MNNVEGDLGIPSFLKREAPAKAAAVMESVMSSNVEVATPTVDTPASKPKKPRTVAKKVAKAVKATPKAKTPVKPAKAGVALDAYGFRVGSFKAKAAALYSKGKGATVDEVTEALGSRQFNLLKTCTERGFTVTKSKAKGEDTRYKLSK